MINKSLRHQLTPTIHFRIETSDLRGWLLRQMITDMAWCWIPDRNLRHKWSPTASTAADCITRRMPFHRRWTVGRFSMAILMVEATVADLLHCFVLVIRGWWPRMMVAYVSACGTLWMVVLMASTVSFRFLVV